MIRRYVILGLVLCLLAACNTPTSTPTSTLTPPPLPPPPSPTPPPWLTPTRPPTTPGYEALVLTVIPEGSVVSFDVAFMRGEISGTIRVKEGTVTLLESDRGTHLIVELHIDMRSLNTGSGLLDGILRSLLKVETHPTALFNGEALDALPGRHPRDETVHIDLPARLTLAEETVSHTVDTEAVLHERRMQLTAAFTVRFEELDARPPPLVGDAISFEVMLTTR